MVVVMLLGACAADDDDGTCWLVIGSHADFEAAECVPDCAPCTNPTANACGTTPCLAVCPDPAPLNGTNCIDAGPLPDAFTFPAPLAH